MCDAVGIVEASLVSLGVLLLLAIGCAPRPTWDEVRAACAVDDAVAQPWGADGTYAPLTETCTAALGDAVGLRWQDFDSAPHAVETPEEPVDHVLAGVYALVAGDLGTTADLAAELGAGEALVADALAAHGTDGPAAAFWYDFVTTRVDHVGFADRQDCVMWERGGGRVDLCDVLDLPGAEASPQLAPAGVAAALVHEAAHVEGVHHAESATCASYDVDAAGAYGAHARWLHGWMRNAGVADADAADAGGNLGLACSRMADPGEHPACATVDVDFCADSAARPVAWSVD